MIRACTDCDGREHTEGLHACNCAEAWLPVLLRNCCVPPMSVDDASNDAGPAPGAFDDGFAGLQLYEFVG